MSDKLKPLGSAPRSLVKEAWGVARFSQIARIRSEKNRPDLPLLSVFLGRGVIPYSDGGGQVHKPSLDLTAYQAVYPGDLVLNNQQAWRGSVGISKHHGIVSPAYLVLSLADSVDRRFANYLFQSCVMVAQFVTSSKGVGDIQRDIHTPWLRNTRVPIPTWEEQAAIVRFLDHADRRIRRYIRAKQKLIKLLEEQRQAIVHRAVTRGLDPNVRLKPSGVDWLREVPEHWEVSRVKTEFQCLNRRRVPLSSTQRGAMTLRRFDYYGASGVIDKVDDFLFEEDLLLIAEDGANLVLRNLPLAIIARGKFWVNNHAHILKPKRGNIEYLAAVMQKLNYMPWISGAAQPKLTQDRLMSITVAVPPRDEQDKIIASAHSETAPLRAAADRAHREVSLLREYRTRLIADVVTGKLDVREAAARLPDEPKEPEQLDEADTLAEGDIEAEANDSDVATEAAEA